MAERRGFFKRAWKWLETVHLIEWIIHTEFVRTAIIPTGLAAVTAFGGYLQNVPVMWISMATAVTFAATMQALLRGSEYRDKKDPLNKIVYVGTVFGDRKSVV